VPTPEEIERMAYATRSKRNRALILMLYTTGLRVSTLRALKINDVIEEMNRGLSIIKIPVYPEMKGRISEACKGGIPYYTFASPEAVEALKEYLDERSKKYGSLNDGEPLFCSDTTNLPVEARVRKPIIQKAVQQIIKRAAKDAGIKRWRDVTPHCMRKAFESALRNNGLDIKDQEFLMVVDAAFTSIGLNYFTAVVPKVEEFNKKFVESGKIKNLKDLAEADINELRKIWENKRS